MPTLAPTQATRDDVDGLDLYMEVLRIVHHENGCTEQLVFSKSTLAMDLQSCQGTLKNLLTQGLLTKTTDTYRITQKGIQTLIPLQRNAIFPAAIVKTHIELIRNTDDTPPALSIITAPNGDVKITKNDVTVELTKNEMLQLWKKLNRDWAND